MTDVRLMLRVASLYYSDGLTHQQIADRFSVSRQTVGRLLRIARETGIVEVRINHPRFLFVEQEQLLERKYGLKEVIIVPAGAGMGTEAVLPGLASTAAQYVAQSVRDGDVLGISWGVTLAALSRYLEHSTARGVKVVQLNGGLGRGQASTNASDILSKFSAAFGAEAFALNVPAIVGNEEICRAIYSDPNIRQTLALAERANICIYSIGALSHMSVLVEAGYISRDDVVTLKAQGVVGDICSRYIDIHGSLADADLNARTIGIELEAFKRKDTTIAVAGGIEKLNAIRGTLAGGYCNVLITDEMNAQELLK